MPVGIVHGVLADASGRIYSSRLSFVYPSEEKSVSLAVDRSDYGKRDSVQLSLCWDGPDSVSCCLSVTLCVLAPRIGYLERILPDSNGYFSLIFLTPTVLNLFFRLLIPVSVNGQNLKFIRIPCGN